MHFVQPVLCLYLWTDVFGMSIKEIGVLTPSSTETHKPDQPALSYMCMCTVSAQCWARAGAATPSEPT